MKLDVTDPAGTPVEVKRRPGGSRGGWGYSLPMTPAEQERDQDRQPKWIEVKSTAGTDGHFDWSRNEFEKALAVRDRYELRRVYRVDSTNPVAKCFVDPTRLIGARRIVLELGMLRANIEGAGWGVASGGAKRQYKRYKRT